MSTNCSVSAFAPVLFGVNFTPTLHEPPGANTLPAVQVEDAIVKLVPAARLAEVILAEPASFDRLVSVTVALLLERPTLTAPNETGDGDTLSAPGVGVGAGVGVGLGVGVGVGFGVGVAVGVGLG